MNQVNKDNDLEERFNFLIQHPDIPIGYYSAVYPLSQEQLRKYSEILDWSRVRSNANINWSIPVIDEFRECIDNSEEERNDVFPSWLSFNRHLDWDMEMVKYYESDLKWEVIVLNRTLLYDREFFLKYSDKIEPYMHAEEFEDLDRIMLKGVMTRDEIVKFFTVNNPFLDYATVKLQKARGIPDDPFEHEPARVWTEAEIMELAEDKGWRNVSASFDIIWTIDLLRKLKDKLTWKMASEKDSYTISENPETYWTDSMIDEFKDLLDFRSFSYKTNVEWSFDLLKRYQDLWEYYWLATNNIMWQKVFPEFIDDGKLEEVMAHCNN